MPVSLRIFKDPACTGEPLSLDGTFSFYDNGVYNGTIGERQVDELYLANLRTTLMQDINSDATAILVNNAYFGIGDVIALEDTEFALVTATYSDAGYDGYIVVRGFAGTSKAAHLTGSMVRAAYDYSDVTLSGYDTDTTAGDEYSWLRLSQTYYDASSSEWDATSTLSVIYEDFAFDQTALVYRNIRVPPGQGAYFKIDLRWRIEAQRFVHSSS